MGESFGGRDEKSARMVTIMENRRGKVAVKRNSEGLCLDNRQLNEHPVCLAVTIGCDRTGFGVRSWCDLLILVWSKISRIV